MVKTRIHRRSAPLQVRDFVPFRASAKRYIVLITDEMPGGFCDSADTTQAYSYAAQAGAQCDNINAILVLGNANAQAVMQNYAQSSCGWYSEVPKSDPDMMSAVKKMLYQAGACNCQ
jgi:hypothetical protein